MSERILNYIWWYDFIYIWWYGTAYPKKNKLAKNYNFWNIDDFKSTYIG